MVLWPASTTGNADRVSIIDLELGFGFVFSEFSVFLFNSNVSVLELPFSPALSSSFSSSLHPRGAGGFGDLVFW